MYIWILKLPLQIGSVIKTALHGKLLISSLIVTHHWLNEARRELILAELQPLQGACPRGGGILRVGKSPGCIQMSLRWRRSAFPISVIDTSIPKHFGITEEIAAWFCSHLSQLPPLGKAEPWNNTAPCMKLRMPKHTPKPGLPQNPALDSFFQKTPATLPWLWQCAPTAQPDLCFPYVRIPWEQGHLSRLLFEAERFLATTDPQWLAACWTLKS